MRKRTHRRFSGVSRQECGEPTSSMPRPHAYVSRRRWRQRIPWTCLMTSWATDNNIAPFCILERCQNHVFQNSIAKVGKLLADVSCCHAVFNVESACHDQVYYKMLIPKLWANDPLSANELYSFRHQEVNSKTSLLIGYPLILQSHHQWGAETIYNKTYLCPNI